MNPRHRLLPPLQLLSTFEAAARLQSFTSAAHELSLTQSAVSRQIRALEEALGSPLFLRERQTVRLTTAGATYAREVAEALGKIAAATLSFRTNPHGGTLNLAILPTFGARWLAPRLPQFLALHPGITVNLTTRLTPFDFMLDTLDAAVHFGTPAWPGVELDFLMKEEVVPACSPAFLAAHPVSGPADLLGVPLLHLASRPNAWQRWFEAQGVAGGLPGGMFVDQFAIAVQAAIAGLGVALLPRFLIESDLAAGDLRLPVDLPWQSEENYYLAWPASRRDYAPLLAFRAWLQAQSGAAAPEAGRSGHTLGIDVG